MNYDALDDAELSLVLGFHLLDLNGISEGTKGKQREGEQTDLEVALALQKTELETRLAVANDRSLSQSIVRAVTQDAEAINAFVREEEQADRDRQLALRSRNGVVPAAELVVPQTPPAVVISTLPAAAGSGSARAPRSHLTSTGSPAVKRELPVDQNGATDGDGHGLDVESRPKKKLIKGTGNAVAAPIQPFNSKPAISGNASVKGKKPASGSRNGDGGTGGQAVKTRSSITIRSSETGKIIALDNLDDDEMPEAESSGWAASRRRHEESSAWAASSRQDNIQGSPETTTIDAPLKVCVSCGDAHSVFDTALCPCKHEYCQECLNNLFQTSLKDESLFPPSCCGQQIPVEKLEISEGSIPLGLMERFTAKKLEMDTPDRTYCHKPTCSMFIYAWYIDGDVGTCVGCDEKTCAKCKGAAHDGDCGEVDEATQEVLRLATENGWQRCISCRSLVELVHGCHHMTCRCGAQFCYICNAAWVTKGQPGACPCAQWDEARLLARAEVVVNRAPENHAAPPAARQEMVQAAAQYLRENHECEDHIWRHLRGSYDCEECGDTLPFYIHECEHCQITLCGRCRYNRL